ncbi:MAG: hypothetical protein H6839_08815 [Planctomycetes bacterium]|nr:hypothetical protein [Planctomycetota bacterium]
MSGIDVQEPEPEPANHDVLKFVALSVFAICMFSLFYRFIAVPTLMYGADNPKFSFVLLPTWLTH